MEVIIPCVSATLINEADIFAIFCSWKGHITCSRHHGLCCVCVDAASDVRAFNVAVGAPKSLENIFLLLPETSLEGPVDVLADIELLPCRSIFGAIDAFRGCKADIAEQRRLARELGARRLGVRVPRRP